MAIEEELRNIIDESMDSIGYSRGIVSYSNNKLSGSYQASMLVDGQKRVDWGKSGISYQIEISQIGIDYSFKFFEEPKQLLMGSVTELEGTVLSAPDLKEVLSGKVIPEIHRINEYVTM